MLKGWKIPLLILSGIILTLVYPHIMHAGHMYKEYEGELARGYSFFRGAFDLGDLNRDGKDEMVIADDEGGFQVYQYTLNGFVPTWINDPIIEDGYILAVEILHDGIPGMMPQILLLDSAGTLHQIRYTGYLYEETATYENYRTPGQTGRIVLTGLASGERTVLIALPNASPTGDGGEPAESPAGSSPAESDGSIGDEWAGMTLYRFTTDGLVRLTESEITDLEEGEVYFISELTGEELAEIQSLGSDAASVFANQYNASNRVGFADFDLDRLLDLMVSVSDPDRPIDRLEIYKEEGDSFTMRITLELPLINEMVLGDVDGDGFTEIVGLTFDGEVLVFQYDPLTVQMSDGTNIVWEYPHKHISGVIWVDPSGFEDLGCNVETLANSVVIHYNRNSVTLDLSGRQITCGDQILLPQIPTEATPNSPVFPLLLSLECLGFHYTYDPAEETVEVEI